MRLNMGAIADVDAPREWTLAVMFPEGNRKKN